MADFEIPDLPDDVVVTMAKRARAAGLSLPDYLRHELVRSGRRHSYLDAIVEFQEIRDREAADLHPSLRVDIDAVLASMRYVRGE
ncbi:hypothetical protein [Nocardia sp. alder85J]|uniref:hypothetical protein n=1 Tax=Nocardia sp. alder85J TaxID=2862949 RepID=UPI001CD1E9E3|nr:hypothetical protein [Nocardia sp. alder85J]MCX4093943.1 hypothetical protein [Nocardia sp. alder85J]